MVLAETTHSGTAGWQQRKKVVKGGSFSFDFVWDSTNIPDVDCSLEPGDEPTLRFYLGDSGKFYEFVGIVEKLSIVDDEQKDVVRGTCSGFVNAAITEPVT